MYVVYFQHIFELVVCNQLHQNKKTYKKLLLLVIFYHHNQASLINMLDFISVSIKDHSLEGSSNSPHLLNLAIFLGGQPLVGPPLGPDIFVSQFVSLSVFGHLT